MTQFPEHEPVPYILERARMQVEAWWPPCQPIVSVPTVLSTQPQVSNGFMDQYAAPFPESPPVIMMPSPTYPAQAGCPVNVATSSSLPSAATAKQPLLLEPCLQLNPAPSLDKPARKPKEPDQPSSSGEHPPGHAVSGVAEVLAPGLVSKSHAGRRGSRARQEEALKHSPEGLSSGPSGARNVENVLSLLRDKTTVMLRNIPNRYTCEELLGEIMAEGFSNMFDFFYLPMDFKTKRNRGYAFINFHSTQVASEFAMAFHHRQLRFYMSRKILEVAPATTQGYQANLSKYINNDSDRIKNDWFKPLLFTQEAFELD